MTKITIKNKGEAVALNYVDYGQGQAVVLIHGWPLSHKSWEKQMDALVSAGFRVIAYDRRGFGDSSAPWDGYSYDDLAADLDTLINELGLEEVILVGFSMGGGEVVRYLTNHGEQKIAKIALVSSIIPLVKQKADNPAGVPEKVLNEILTALKTDRLKFLTDFHQGFYNYSKAKPTVSAEQLTYDFSIASHAAPQATIKAAQAWMDTDFRKECAEIQVPTLIIHGDADATVPFDTAAKQAHELIKGSQLIAYPEASHGLNVTHAEQLNKDLIAFFKG